MIDHAAGRRPLRSSSAPTRRPSLNTNAPGPSHGATNPATRRRKAATAGCGVRRRPGASGTSGEQRGLERPAGRDQQLERLVERPRVRDARREEGTGRAEAVGRVPAARRDARVVAPAADRLAVAADRVDLAVVGDVPERLGERPHGLRVGGVALVEQGERERRRATRGRGTASGEAAAGDEALVDDGLRRRRDHRERRQAGRACRRVGAAAGAGERELELGVGHAVRPRDQRLEDLGQGGGGHAAEGIGLDGHRAPGGRAQAFGGERGGDDRARVGGRGASLGGGRVRRP